MRVVLSSFANDRHTVWEIIWNKRSIAVMQRGGLRYRALVGRRTGKQRGGHGGTIEDEFDRRHSL